MDKTTFTDAFALKSTMIYIELCEGLVPHLRNIVFLDLLTFESETISNGFSFNFQYMYLCHISVPKVEHPFI